MRGQPSYRFLTASATRQSLSDLISDVYTMVYIDVSESDVDTVLGNQQFENTSLYEHTVKCGNEL